MSGSGWWICLAAAVIAVMGWQSAAGAGTWPTGKEVVPLKAKPVDLKDVRLLDGPFKDAMQRDRKYLLALESDRLLHSFRVTAGLPAPGEPMGGWERTELRGHTMGHYLSACALMYASTGDEDLKAKADALVAELAKCQKALGPRGYLSAFPESFIDRVMDCKPVWAPWYTLHKLLAGLIDVHAHCGNRQALEVAESMAEWIEGRMDKLDAAATQRMLRATEQGGMNEALANLYGLTGDKHWLGVSRRFVEDHYVQPLAARKDQLTGEHVNSFIPNIIGTARQYELGGVAGDREIATFFWDAVVGGRCYATGGTSNEEHWRTDPHKLADQLGDHTQETCCTYNMLKLTRHLLAWDPQARYGDYYEQALINSILSTQDPATGMMMYFVPLASGRWKLFNTPRDSFWCCTGTGMENHATYADTIYYRDEGGVWVNLFIASELHLKDRGVRIRQHTKFPQQPGTMLIVMTANPVELELRVRVPGWLAGPVKAKVNGQAIEAKPNAAGYLCVRRTWNDDDRLEVDLPMALRAAPMPDDKTLLAVMYGPLVLAGELGGEGLTDALTYRNDNWYKFPPEQIAAAPAIVTENPDPAGWVKPVEGKALTFRTAGVGRPKDVTLVPYYSLFGQRYAVYWRVVTAGQWERMEADRKAREAQAAERAKLLRERQVDSVAIGDAESEKSHALEHKGSSSGLHGGRTWRHAAGEGAWFSYRLKVPQGGQAFLLCTYWGGDVDRTFDVLVDGTKVATQKLQNNQPGEFFDVEYPIPAELTKGKEQVTVKFAAPAGGTAGGVFGVATLKEGKGSR
jgi:uncharacterized protein